MSNSVTVSSTSSLISLYSVVARDHLSCNPGTVPTVPKLTSNIEPCRGTLNILAPQPNCTAGKASTKTFGAPSEKPSPQVMPFTVLGATSSAPGVGVVQPIFGVGEGP